MIHLTSSPFTSLKFKEGATKWRVKPYRFNIQTNENSTWIKMPQTQLLGNLAFMGELNFERPLGQSRPPLARIRYLNWLTQVLKLNLGYSDYYQGFGVTRYLFNRFLVTLILSFSAILLSTFISLTLSTYFCTSFLYLYKKTEKYFDKIVSKLFLTLLYAVSTIPSFILGYLFYTFYGMTGDFLIAILILSIGSGIPLEISRLHKIALQKELSSKYIESALAKGLPFGSLFHLKSTVIGHALRNTSIIIIPIISSKIPVLISEAIVVEIIFELAGLGGALLESLVHQDLPMILTIVLILIVIVRILSFLSDFLFFLLNPKKVQ